MKQLDLLPKRAKPKFCNWLKVNPLKTCKAPAVVMIGQGAYCAEHAEKAQKYFGQGKPIYALDATGV